MGNCQATDAAAVVIQHPGGRVERLYWPTPASEVMRSNPGHYVALITLCRLPGEGVPAGHPREAAAPPSLKGREVIKGLRARKQEKMRAQMDVLKKQRQHERTKAPLRDELCSESAASSGGLAEPDHAQAAKEEERNRHRVAQSTSRLRQWRPSLQSISEVGG
ncbi:unnamed protein product [Spirodela intermedia]|uniref:Uncharacterized protein n=1 Tax=Spirodela intermedia TaxID=51605 RepID=A0A7I8JKG3_SPIIN|nr:unnamed protein product [Spirodela intermedia]CAA6670619.1 unnamed protein product [Spirodela intermedia]